MPTPTAKELFLYINSSNQLVSGATITLRAPGGNIDVATYVEPDSVNWPGYYYVIAPQGRYEMWINGVYQFQFSLIWHTDPNLP